MSDVLQKKRQAIIRQFVTERIIQGLTQEELAERIGTQRSNICRLESGKQNPSLDLMVKLSQALGKELEFNLVEKEESHMDKYVLRMFDVNLIEFTLEEKGLEGLTARIDQTYEDKEYLFPLDLKVSGEGLLEWLQKRVIPKNRAFVDEILQSLGLSANDTKGIIDVCKGLSLTDSYWIVPCGFEGKFADYNLFENRFSEILSLVAYTGVGRTHEAFSTSPELTTGGALPKAWRYIDGDGVFLYKGGTTGGANTGKEPFSEYYAFQIAKQMGLNAVEYDLENWKGLLASKCRLFTDIGTSFVPAYGLVGKDTLKPYIDYYRNLGEEYYEQLCSMLVFDAVIYNEDRHFGNFGILRDNKTGQIISPAPIFDNGLSLFSAAMPDEFENIGEYAATRMPPYRNVTFEAICREVIGRKQMQQLRKLLGFHFKRHPKINLPEKRLMSIEAQIQKRASYLLELPGN